MLPETSAVTDAIAALSPTSDGTVTPSFTTAPGYPLSVVTYLLVRQDNPSRQTALNLRTFAGLLLANNDDASSLAYAPLPPSLTAYAKGQIATIGPGGSVPASTTTVPPPSSAPPSELGPADGLPDSRGAHHGADHDAGHRVDLRLADRGSGSCSSRSAVASSASSTDLAPRRGQIRASSRRTLRDARCEAPSRALTVARYDRTGGRWQPMARPVTAAPATSIVGETPAKP